MGSGGTAAEGTFLLGATTDESYLRRWKENGVWKMALKLASFIVDAVSSKVIGTFQVRNSTDTATHMTVNSTTGDVVIEKKLDVKGKIYSEDGTVWHSNNDGSGSGLDADLFDGVDSSYFDKTNPERVVADLNTLTSTGTYFWNVGSSNIPAPLYGNYGTLIVRARDGNNVTQIAVSKDFEFMWFRRKNNGSWSGWMTLWNTCNQGSGSGLNADLLDGQHGSYYAQDSAVVKLSGNQTIGGTKTFSSLINGLS